MKKNVLISITALLLLVAGALGGFFILKSNTPDSQPESGLADIQTLIKNNEDTVFSYLTEEKNQLPENMTGYLVDISKDIDFSDSTGETVRKSIFGLFEKVNAINPNTVIVRYDTSFSHKTTDIDAVECLINALKENGKFTILFIDDEKHNTEKTTPDEISKETKAIEQRIRRTIFAAMINLSNLGIVDHTNSEFEYYAPRFFDFTEIRIPTSVTYIGNDVFVECGNLKTVYYGGTYEELEEIQNIDSIFYGVAVDLVCSDGTYEIDYRD
mgnify:CR=1 FL=1